MSDYYKLAAVKLDKDRYTRLVGLCDTDYRSISDELRWLIDRECDRRDHTLVDTKAQYITATIGDDRA